MKIAVVGESRPGERRVALVPGLVSRLTDVDLDVAVEPGAGEAAGYADEDYRNAVAAATADALAGAEEVRSLGAEFVELALPTLEGAGGYAREMTAAMVAAMKPGSVVVDLAAESGGNVEGAEPGEEIIAGCRVTHAGEVRHVPTRELLEGQVS